MHTYTTLFRLLLGGCGLMLLFLAGCDTVDEGGEEIILPNLKRATFEFEIESGGQSAGQTLEVPSQETQSLEGRLDGFSRDEIVGATVEQATLRLGFPLDENFASLLQRAELRLEAQGLPARTVDVLTTLPDSRTVEFALSSSPDVAEYAAQPSFSATLVLTTEAWEADTYTFELDMDLRIVVSGL